VIAVERQKSRESFSRRYNKRIISLGYIDGRHVVVPECGICGNLHRHGSKGHRVGDILTRAPHCGAAVDNRPAQAVVVIVRRGELE